MSKGFWTPERLAIRRAAIDQRKAEWRAQKEAAGTWLPREQFEAKLIADSAARAVEKDAALRETLGREEEDRTPALRDRCRKYGLSVRDYLAMDAAQKGLCAVPDCGKPHEDIDHCHFTNRVRGLLCHGCNIALGHLVENEVRAAGMLEYIRTKVRQ